MVITLRELVVSDMHLQAEPGGSEPEGMAELRKELNRITREHFKSKPFSEVSNQEAPSAAVEVFERMCDLAENAFPGYIPPRVVAPEAS